jgi:hypothetical protein
VSVPAPGPPILCPSLSLSLFKLRFCKTRSRIRRFCRLASSSSARHLCSVSVSQSWTTLACWQTAVTDSILLLLLLLLAVELVLVLVVLLLLLLVS